MVKVTVYITSHNYEKYIEKAIQSVLNQTYQDFELIIIDDGSTDGTRKILEKYADAPKTSVIFQENKGLAKTCNVALQLAKGEYIVRLDADDYFDESALLVLANLLDVNPEVGLVYPDYFEIDSEGELLGLVRRKKMGKESKLLDLPAHGACTMIRTDLLRKVGGYSEEIMVQDGYDLWIRFIQEFKPYNVNIPLFYYRKHSQSITASPKKVLDARKKIKENFVAKNGKRHKTCLIIPIRGDSVIVKDLPLKEVAGKAMMEYVIDEAVASKFDKVVVTTEDKKVAKKAEREGVQVIMRPKKLTEPGTPIEPSINYVLDELKKEKFVPEVVGVIFYTSPLLRAKHFKEAVHTLMIYDADTVIGVRENPRLHYSHGEFGLRPLYKDRGIKQEREFLYEESGAFIFSRAKIISEKSLVGEKVGHVVLTEDESVDIEDMFTYWLAKQILEHRDEVDNLDVKKIGRGY